MQTETKASSTVQLLWRLKGTLSLFLSIFVWLVMHLMQLCHLRRLGCSTELHRLTKKTWACNDFILKEYHIIQEGRPKWSFYCKWKLQTSPSVLKVPNEWQWSGKRAKLNSYSRQVFVLFGHPYNFFFFHHDRTYGNLDPCTLVHFNSQQVLTKQVPLNALNPLLVLELRNSMLTNTQSRDVSPFCCQSIPLTRMVVNN